MRKIPISPIVTDIHDDVTKAEFAKVFDPSRKNPFLAIKTQFDVNKEDYEQGAVRYPSIGRPLVLTNVGGTLCSSEHHILAPKLQAFIGGAVLLANRINHDVMMHYVPYFLHMRSDFAYPPIDSLSTVHSRHASILLAPNAAETLFLKLRDPDIDDIVTKETLKPNIIVFIDEDLSAHQKLETFAFLTFYLNQIVKKAALFVNDRGDPKSPDFEFTISQS